MKAKTRLCALAALAVFLISLAPAWAKTETTATSTVTQIQILEPSDERYELFHGVLWLDYDKSRHNYRWGGKHCSQQGISDMNLSLLFAAFRAQHRITLRYRNRLYSGTTYRCITGFIVARS